MRGCGNGLLIPTAECLKIFSHLIFHYLEHMVTRAMAGKESGVWILGFQASGQGCQFIFRLIPVEQMEAANDSLNGVRTGGKDILQAAMSTACKQETIRI